MKGKNSHLGHSNLEHETVPLGERWQEYNNLA